MIEGLESRRVLTDVSGIISTNTTWTAAQSPYNLVGDVFVRAGATLTIQTGVTVTTSAGRSLNVSDDAAGATINATGATFNAWLNLGAASRGTIQTTRWQARALTVGSGSEINLVGNSFHSGSTQSTTPVMIDPNLTAKLDGNTFDAGFTRIGILGGNIVSPVQWKKLTNVAGYHLVNGNDLTINTGASLNVVVGNTVTRESSLSDIYVNSNGALNADGVTFSIDVNMRASSSGTIQNSRWDSEFISLESGTTANLVNNSFHSGLTQNTIPVWVAPNLTSKLDGNSFDAGSTRIGILGGTISNTVLWKLLPNVAGYHLLAGDDLTIGNGGSLTVQSGNSVTRESSLSNILVNSGGTLNTNGVTFSIDVTMRGGSLGTLQNSRWEAWFLSVEGGSNVQLVGNSFHSGGTQNSIPVFIDPNLVSKLDGSNFDTGLTRIGILGGTINGNVFWKKLPNVEGYHLLQGEDLNIGSGAILTIAPNVSLTRESNLSEIFVLSGGTFNADGVNFNTRTWLRGNSQGTIQNSRWSTESLTIEAASNVTLVNNVFHTGETSASLALFVHPTLVSKINGNTFDPGISRIGILGGTINGAVQWNLLPNLAGYHLANGDDVLVNSGGNLTIAPGASITRESNLSEIVVGSVGQGSMTASNVTFETSVTVRGGASGELDQNYFGAQSSLIINNGHLMTMRRNDFRNIPQVFAEGSSSATINLDNNYWGTTLGAEIEAKITHRPDTTPPSRPLITFANPINPNTLGGLVWDDSNGNGIRNIGELGRAGITAKLRGAGIDGLVGTTDDDPLNDVAAVVTSASGAYQISIPPAHVTKQLYVAFTKPNGTEFTLRNNPFAGDNLDSDVDSQGRSGALVWFDKRVDFSTDAGLIAQAPEIELSSNGFDLFDDLSRIQFGSTIVGTPVSRTILVLNSGTAPLTLTQPTIALGSGFAISQPLSTLNLAPGASTSFVVTLTATTNGTQAARLQLLSNDSDETSFDLNLSGIVEIPQATTDIRMLPTTSNGSNTMTIQYEIAVGAAPAFSISVYRADNNSSLTGAVLLDTVDISNPADLTVGLHNKTFTIGGNPGEIGLPGLGATDFPDIAYRILLVADPDNVIDEVDNSPIAEDNLQVFQGAYKAGSSLFVHGTEGPDTLTWSASGANHVLTLNSESPWTYTSSSIVLAYFRSQAGADTIIGQTSTRAMKVMGGDGNDVINTGTGADTLMGNGGDDQLNGGSGNDTYAFDADNDLGVDTLTDATGIETLSFVGTTANLTLDLSLTATQSVTGLLGIVLAASNTFDNVIGGDGNDQILGNSVANSLTGGAGNDQLNGSSGNDTYLFDADTPLGSDTLTDTSGTETISFAGTTSGMLFSLATTALQVVNPRLSLTLASSNAFDNVIGGNGNDQLTGNSLANQLTGSAGNDTLIGGSGNDTYFFDADSQLGSDTLNETGGGIDVLNFSSTTTKSIAIDLSLATVQVVNSNLSLTLGSGSTFENVAGGALADTLTGNSLANELVGNAGNDTLSGLDGSDLLYGNAGDDQLLGGLADDTYYFDADLLAGNDTVDESTGGGVDTLNFASTTTKSLSLDLSNGLLQTVVPTNLGITIINAANTIEGIVGGSLADNLTGNGLDNILQGNGGNDVLNGAAGNDRYLFDLDVAQGSDTLLDVSGIDGLDFSLTTAQVVTLDLALTNQVVHTNLSLTLPSATTFENAIGGSKNDTLLGNILNNLLSGGAGNDILKGLQGRDVLLGGSGNDTLEGGDDEDLLIGGTTSHDSNYRNLQSIQSAWGTADPYLTRINSLRAGVNGVSLVAATTVLNSGVDSLKGDAGLDWFFAGLDDTVVDLAVNELVDAL